MGTLSNAQSAFTSRFRGMLNSHIFVHTVKMQSENLLNELFSDAFLSSEQWLSGVLCH